MNRVAMWCVLAEERDAPDLPFVDVLVEAQEGREPWSGCVRVWAEDWEARGGAHAPRGARVWVLPRGVGARWAERLAALLAKRD